jgi:hypothetical protein
LKVENLKDQIAKAKGTEEKTLSMQLNRIWWTHDDLRRTVDTMMNDRLSVLPYVVDAALNQHRVTRAAKAA